ncbi:nuclear receptor coactivator 6-like [Solea solea]|uniref:nuclear receptor coactivator 6-like n=1 Tax=Solea solea TaxID=90069 RepID=UPI00272988F1|nr:nuclear receptor coactivator 6-like [Solea solea]
MITLILLSCFTIIVSAVPVYPSVHPPQLSQGGVQHVQPVEATHPKPEAETAAPLLEQPQPGAPQQQGPLGGPQPVPPMQHYTWPPLGDSVMIIPLHMSMHGPQLANQPALPQQPMIFPSYGYFPLVSPSYRNQLSSPYGFPNILQAPLPQTPANQPPTINNQVVAAETPIRTAPTGNAPQPVQQQQTPQIVYMFQQPMNSALGALSSEELEMAAKMNQLGVYMPTMLTNLPSGAVQTLNQAAGLPNPEQAGVGPTAGAARASQLLRLVNTGLQPNTASVPANLKRGVQEVATDKAPAQAKLQTTQRNRRNAS